MLMEKPCRLARMSLIFIDLSRHLLAQLSKKRLSLSTIDNQLCGAFAMDADATVAELLPGFTRRRFKTAGAEINAAVGGDGPRSEEHTSELQSLMRISYAVFCLK